MCSFVTLFAEKFIKHEKCLIKILCSNLNRVRSIVSTKQFITRKAIGHGNTKGWLRVRRKIRRIKTEKSLSQQL